MTCRPLYEKYPRQTKAQRACLEIDENGRLSVDIDPEIGGAVPMDVRFGVRQWFTMPNNLTQGEIDELIKEVTPLAKRYSEITEIGYRDTNRVRRARAGFKEEAEELESQIEDLCSTFETLVYDLCDDETCEYCYPDTAANAKNPEHPKPQSQEALKTRVEEALKDNEKAVKDGDEGMIGDLTKADAWTVAEMLEDLGYSTRIEDETDNRGNLVDSADWKKVEFWMNGRGDK